jgi:hypothetical protein
MKLTDNLLRQLPPPARDKRIYYDDAVKGFGCRVSSTGTRTFVLTYRRKADGHQRRITIGSFPDWGVATAREEAKRLKREVDGGVDPLGPKQPVSNKWSFFIEQAIEPTCYLYRHYHPNGDLLYVGVSLHALLRQSRHLKEATWRNLICWIAIEPFETREEALAAEETAIRNEFPKFNSKHNSRRHPFQELAREQSNVSAQQS